MMRRCHASCSVSSLILAASCGLCGTGAVKLADGGVHVAELFLLGAGEPADALDRLASRPVRLVEDPGEQHGQGLFAVVLDPFGEAVHGLGGLVFGDGAGNGPRREGGDVAVLRPGLEIVIDRRTGPDRSRRKRRHENLDAGPVGRRFDTRLSLRDAGECRQDDRRGHEKPDGTPETHFVPQGRFVVIDSSQRKYTLCLA